MKANYFLQQLGQPHISHAVMPDPAENARWSNSSVSSSLASMFTSSRSESKHSLKTEISKEEHLKDEPTKEVLRLEYVADVQECPSDAPFAHPHVIDLLRTNLLDFCDKPGLEPRLHAADAVVTIIHKHDPWLLRRFLDPQTTPYFKYVRKEPIESNRCSVAILRYQDVVVCGHFTQQDGMTNWDPLLAFNMIRVYKDGLWVQEGAWVSKYCIPGKRTPGLDLWWWVQYILHVPEEGIKGADVNRHGQNWAAHMLLEQPWKKEKGRASVVMSYGQLPADLSHRHPEDLSQWAVEGKRRERSRSRDRRRAADLSQLQEEENDSEEWELMSVPSRNC